VPRLGGVPSGPGPGTPESTGNRIQDKDAFKLSCAPVSKNPALGDDGDEPMMVIREARTRQASIHALPAARVGAQPGGSAPV